MVHPCVFLIDGIHEFRKLILEDCTDGQCTKSSFIIGCKVKAADGSGFRILKYQFSFGGIDRTAFDIANGHQRNFQVAELYVIGIDLHYITVVDSLHRQFHRFMVDRIQTVFSEVELHRFNYVQCLTTKNAALPGNGLNFHITQTGSGKYIVLCQGANVFIGNSHHSAFWQVNGAAGSRDTRNLDGKLCANRQIVIVRGENRMVKFVGGFGSGHHHQRGTHGTFKSVRGTVHNRDRVGTLCLGCKGTGTAAVQVNRSGTARVQHDLGNFLQTAACGEGLLAAIENHQNDPSVIGDTHTGTGYPLVIVILGMGNGRLSILYQENARANGLLQLVVVSIPFRRATNNRRTVFQYAKEVLTRKSVVLHAFHDERTGRRARLHIIEVAVHANHSTVVSDVVLRIIGI